MASSRGRTFEQALSRLHFSSAEIAVRLNLSHAVRVARRALVRRRPLVDAHARSLLDAEVDAVLPCIVGGAACEGYVQKSAPPGALTWRARLLH